MHRSESLKAVAGTIILLGFLCVFKLGVFEPTCLKNHEYYSIIVHLLVIREQNVDTSFMGNHRCMNTEHSIIFLFRCTKHMFNIFLYSPYTYFITTETCTRFIMITFCENEFYSEISQNFILAKLQVKKLTCWIKGS